MTPVRAITRVVRYAALGLSLTALPAFALGDGPAIATDWADLTVPKSECFARGEEAIQRMGFGEIERTKYSRFGTREDYTVSVRCIEEKGLVLFLASGRDRQLQTNCSSIFSGAI